MSSLDEAETVEIGTRNGRPLDDDGDDEASLIWGLHLIIFLSISTINNENPIKFSKIKSARNTKDSVIIGKRKTNLQ